jgi:hypothetical protein
VWDFSDPAAAAGGGEAEIIFLPLQAELRTLFRDGAATVSLRWPQYVRSPCEHTKTVSTEMTGSRNASKEYYNEPVRRPPLPAPLFG